MKVYSNLTHTFFLPPHHGHMAATAPLSRAVARLVSCPTLLSRQAGNRLPCLQIPTIASSPTQSLRFIHESRRSMQDTLRLPTYHLFSRMLTTM